MRTARQEPTTSAGWGLGDAALWFGVAFIGQGFWALLIGQVLHGDGGMPDSLPITTLFVIQIWLWFAYGVGPVVTVTRKGAGAVADLGASITWSDVGIGALLGVVLQLLILPLMYWPLLKLVDADPSAVAEELVDRVGGWGDVILLVVIVGIAAPLVEELFYRGLLLGALRQRFGDWTSIGIQAVVFAGVHLQGIQFPGLLIVGLVLGWLRVRFGRLGPAWAAHFGFNVATLVLLLKDVSF